MSKVAIVTDSSAYIPANLLQGMPIFTIPLHITWDGKNYLDNVDLSPDEFYPRLQTSSTMPKTSQTTPAEFTTLYRSLLEKGYDILGIHLSSRLSGTFDSARQAKNMLTGANIELVDSETAAMALGFHVLSAASASLQGADLHECKELAEKARYHSSTFFIPGTLEYLRRGGRIGGAAAFLGSIMQFKPILEPRNGLVEAVERVRTMNRAIEQMIEIIEKRVGDMKPIHLAAMHTLLPDKAAEILAATRQKLGIERIIESVITTISPALGTHIGPGAVGLAYLAGI